MKPRLVTPLCPFGRPRQPDEALPQGQLRIALLPDDIEGRVDLPTRHIQGRVDYRIWAGVPHKLPYLRLPRSSYR